MSSSRGPLEKVSQEQKSGAVVRSSSVPLTVGSRASSLVANPFWSERIKSEIALARARPVDLPVPASDHDLDDARPMALPSAVEAERAKHLGAAWGPVRERGARAESDWKEKFKTPSGSSTRQGKGYGLGGAGLKSEGRLPAEKLKDPQSYVNADQEVEREVERAMMEHVLEKNQQLTQEVERLSKLMREKQAAEVSSSSWSTATPPPPPPPKTPDRGIRSRTPRYTPHGTRVPDSPEQDEMMWPELPPWPGLRSEDPRGGDWDFLEKMEPAQAHPEDQRRGISRGGETQRPRYDRAGDMERDGVATPREARMMWMERELKSLQDYVRQKESGQRESSYWSKPFIPDPDDDPKPHGMARELQRYRERSRERRGAEEFQEEVLRSYPVVLPKLGEPGEKFSALMAGDWITQVRPLMADVSGKAGWWWDKMVTATTQRYLTCLEAPPLEKLHVLPPADEDLPAGYERLAQRITNMLIAAELGASLPDPTLLIQALDTTMRKVLRLDSQAAFPVSVYRMQQHVDVKPSHEGACRFHEILLAEAELLAGGQSRTSDELVKPEVKMLQAMPNSPQKPQNAQGGLAVCKWWGSEGGCRNAKSCRQFHPALDDRHERCWLCSSRNHRKADCPYRPSPDQLQNATGGSGEDGKGKGKGKSKKGSKDGKSSGKDLHYGGKDGSASSKGAGTTSTAAPAASTEEKRDGKAEAPAVQKAEVVQGRSEDQASGDTAALMSEATTFLRSFRAGGADGTPQLRACKLRRLDAGNEAVATLLDGGATHCLRQSRSDQEWERALEGKAQVCMTENDALTERKMVR